MLDLNGFQVYLRLRSGYTVAHDPATVERLGTTVFADVKVTRQVFYNILCCRTHETNSTAITCRLDIDLADGKSWRKEATRNMDDTDSHKEGCLMRVTRMFTLSRRKRIENDYIGGLKIKVFRYKKSITKSDEPLAVFIFSFLDDRKATQRSVERYRRSNPSCHLRGNNKTSIANEDTSKQSASISDQANESSADELEDECTSYEPAGNDADARLSSEIPLALSLKRSRSHLSEAVPKPKRLRRDTISNPENNGEDVELHVQTERLIEEYRQVEDEGVRLEKLVYHALNDKIQARRVRNEELSALASKFECKQEE